MLCFKYLVKVCKFQQSFFQLHQSLPPPTHHSINQEVAWCQAQSTRIIQKRIKMWAELDSLVKEKEATTISNNAASCFSSASFSRQRNFFLPCTQSSSRKIMALFFGGESIWIPPESGNLLLPKPEKSFSFLFYYHLLIYTAPLLRNKGFMLDEMMQE